jgi:hypothetical protein
MKTYKEWKKTREQIAVKIYLMFESLGLIKEDPDAACVDCALLDNGCDFQTKVLPMHPGLPQPYSCPSFKKKK